MVKINKEYTSLKIEFRPSNSLVKLVRFPPIIYGTSLPASSAEQGERKNKTKLGKNISSVYLASQVSGCNSSFLLLSMADVQGWMKEQQQQQQQQLSRAKREGNASCAD